MRKHISKKTAAVATVLTLGTGAAAFAYWTTTGTGSGSATVGTSANFNVTSYTDASAGPLSPNGPTQTVHITVANPGTGYQKVSQVVASVASTDKPGCSAADFSVGGAVAGQPSTVTFGENLAPGADASHSVSLQMVDTGVAQDACKDAVVTLALAAS